MCNLAFTAAGGDVAELLETVDEPLEEIAFAVEPGVAGVALGAIGAPRDHRHGPLLGQRQAEVVGVVGAVGDDVLQPKPGDELAREQHVAAMAGRNDDAHRQAERIDGNVQL